MLGHKEPPFAEPPEYCAGRSRRQSHLGPENVYRERKHPVQGTESFRSAGAIPADIKTIMIAGPQYDFSDREMKLLRDFWNKQGRILLLVDPAAKTPKLLAFLNELGVKVNDDRLMAMVKTGIEEVARVRDVVARFLGRQSDHETAGRCARAVSSARPVR